MHKITRAEQKASRPGQILDAAFEEFIEKGFNAARVEDIAMRVGVTKGTIYVYFPTKEDLFTAMVLHIARPLAVVHAISHELTGSCSQQLRSLLKLWYEHIVEDRRTRELLRFVISEGPRFHHLIDAHYREIIEPVLERIQALLDQGIRQGEFKSGPAAHARVVLAPCGALMIDMLIHGDSRDHDIPAYIEAHLDLVMRAFTADGQDQITRCAPEFSIHKTVATAL